VGDASNSRNPAEGASAVNETDTGIARGNPAEFSMSCSNFQNNKDVSCCNNQPESEVDGKVDDNNSKNINNLNENKEIVSDDCDVEVASSSNYKLIEHLSEEVDNKIEEVKRVFNDWKDCVFQSGRHFCFKGNVLQYQNGSFKDVIVFNESVDFCLGCGVDGRYYCNDCMEKGMIKCPFCYEAVHDSDCFIEIKFPNEIINTDEIFSLARVYSEVIGLKLEDSYNNKIVNVACFNGRQPIHLGIKYALALKYINMFDNREKFFELHSTLFNQVSYQGISDNLGSICSKMFEFLGRIRSFSVSAAVSSFINSITEMLVKSAVGGAMSSIYSMISKVLQDNKDKILTMFVLACKSILRLVAKYETKYIILEFFGDLALCNNMVPLQFITAAVSRIDKLSFFQSNYSPLLFFVAILSSKLIGVDDFKGYNVTKLFDESLKLSTSLTAFIEKSDFLPECVNTFLFGNKYELIKHKYPAVFIFRSWILDNNMEQLTATKIRVGKKLWKDCNDEIKRANIGDVGIIKQMMPPVPDSIKEQDNGARSQPFCLVFYGAPGAGKSHLASKIGDSLVRCDIKEEKVEHPEDFIYEYSNASDHWDGLKTGCSQVRFDDFLSRSDNASNPSREIYDFLNLVGIANFRPSMAELSNKGMRCAPNSVIVTTNHHPDAWPQLVKSITNSDALNRRVSLVVTVASTTNDCERPSSETQAFVVSRNGKVIPPRKLISEDKYAKLNCKNKGSREIWMDMPEMLVTIGKNYKQWRTAVPEPEIDFYQLISKAEQYDWYIDKDSGKEKEKEKEEVIKLEGFDDDDFKDDDYYEIGTTVQINDTIPESPDSWYESIKMFGVRGFIKPKVDYFKPDDFIKDDEPKDYKIQREARERIRNCAWDGEAYNGVYFYPAGQSRYITHTNFDYIKFENYVKSKTSEHLIGVSSVVFLMLSYATYKIYKSKYPDEEVTDSDSTRLITIFGEQYEAKRVVCGDKDYAKIFVPTKVSAQLNLDAIRFKQAGIIKEADLYLNAQQSVSVQKNICQIMHNDKLMCYGLFVDGSTLMVPHHVYNKYHEKLFVNTNSYKNIAISKEDVSSVDYSDYDVSVIKMKIRVSNVKDIRNRFVNNISDVKNGGVITRLHMDGSKDSATCTVEKTRMVTGYVFQDIVSCNLKGENGFCGLPYFYQNEIIGLHFAGKLFNFGSFAKLMDRRFVDSIQKDDISSAQNTTFNALVAEDKNVEVLVRNGVTPVGTCVKTVKISRDSKLEPTKYHAPISQNWDYSCELAQLAPYVVNNKVFRPEEIRLKKLAAKNKEAFKHVDYSSKAYQLSIDELSTHVYDCSEKMSFDEVTKSTSDLNPVDRSKAVGYTLRGLCPTTHIMCDVDEEEPILCSESRDLLNKLMKRLESGEIIEFVNIISLKDEKVSKDKKDAKDTRIFTSVDKILFFLMKIYFGRSVAWLNEKSEFMGIGARLTVKEISSNFDKYRKCSMLPGDISTQDASHMLYKWLEFFKWLIMVGLIKNENPEVLIEGSMYSKENAARYSLLYSSFMSPFLYESIMVYFLGMLTSGSFITFNFNCWNSYMIWCEFRTIVEDPDNWKVCIYGDDTVLIKLKGLISDYEKSLWISLFKKYNYVLTGSVKSQPPAVTNVYDIEYCGRKFNDESKVMCLTNFRLCKNIQFCKKGRFHETMPGQMTTFVLELSLQKTEVWNEYVRSIEFNGRRLDNYVPSKEVCMKAYLDGDNKVTSNISANMYAFFECVLIEDDEVVLQGDCDISDMKEILVDSKRAGLNDMIKMDDITQTSFAANAVQIQPQMVAPLPHKVQEIFGRRFKVAEFIWSTASTGSLWTANFPSTYFNNNRAAQMHLSNTSGLRCGVELEVVINSVITQSGICVFAGSPMAAPQIDPRQATTGPHGYIYAGSHQTTCFSIPYARDSACLLPSSYGTISNDQFFDFVTVQMWVLCPLRSANADSVSVQIYAKLTNPEVFYANSMVIPLSPQGDGEVEDIEDNDEDDYDIIEDVFGTAHKTLDLAEGMTRIALGHSKPPYQNKAEVMVHDSNLGMCSFTGLDAAPVLGGSQGSGVIVKTENSTCVDTMMIENLCRRESVLTVFEWTTAQVANHVLYTIPIIPSYAEYYNNDYLYTSAVSYLCNFFELCRCTMVYTIRFSKTNLHSGVLYVGVNYGETDDQIDSSSKQLLLPATIIDLSNHTDVVIEVPFWYYKQMWEVDAITPEDEFDQYLSRLNFVVSSPLTSASGIDRIDVVVDVYAKDVHFSCPVYKNTVTYDVNTVDIDDNMIDDIYAGDYDRFFKLCLKVQFDRRKIWNFKINKRNRKKYHNFLNEQDYRLFCMGIIKPLIDDVVMQGKEEKPKEKENKEKEKGKEKEKPKVAEKVKTKEKEKPKVKEAEKKKVKKPAPKAKPKVNSRNNKEKSADPAPSNTLFQPEVNLPTAFVLAPFKNVVSDEYIRCIMNDNIGSLKQLFNRYVNIGTYNITSGDLILLQSHEEIEGFGVAELTWMFTFACGGYSMKMVDQSEQFEIFDLRRYRTGIPQSGLNPVYVKDDGNTSTIVAPRYSNFPFFAVRSNAMFYEQIHFLSNASVETPKPYSAYFRFSDDFVLWGRNFLPFMTDQLGGLDFEEPAVLGNISGPRPMNGWFVDKQITYEEFFRYNRDKKHK